MGNIITELKDEARQEGRLESLRDSLRMRIQAGVLTIDTARAEVAMLVTAQVITAPQAERLLAELG